MVAIMQKIRPINIERTFDIVHFPKNKKPPDEFRPAVLSESYFLDGLTAPPAHQ